MVSVVVAVGKKGFGGGEKSGSWGNEYGPEVVR